MFSPHHTPSLLSTHIQHIIASSSETVAENREEILAVLPSGHRLKTPPKLPHRSIMQPPTQTCVTFFSCLVKAAWPESWAMRSFKCQNDRSSPCATAEERREKLLHHSGMGWPWKVSHPSAHLLLTAVGAKYPEQENTETSMLI